MGFGYCSFASTFLLSILSLLLGSTNAILSPNFYSTSCPQALYKIRKGVERAIDIEKRMGASLLRLHFHDCFVQKCDGSILLDDNATFTGEKTAFPNVNSVRGFEVIDNIKAELEQICPGVVSCADILTVAARDSVVELGGPSWIVPLGRRDSKTANLTEANTDLPPPFANLTSLISSFAKKNLTTRDMVALSGAHTIGFARCVTFRDRIYNDTNINPHFAALQRSRCPRTGGDNNLSRLDLSTPIRFDNHYYDNLLDQKGLLHSDQELFNGGSTNSLVSFYSSNTNVFFRDFANAMVKMGNIALTGSDGEVRINCRRVN